MKLKSSTIQNIFSFGSVGMMLAAWWAITSMGLIRPLILPSPNDVVNGVIDIWNGYLGVPFWNHFTASLSVVVVSFI